MITSKERAFLKRIISSQSSIYQIGKDGLSENCLHGIKEVLKARELIKINVLQNCELSPKVLSGELENLLKCEVVAVIGRKIVLYKFNPKNKQHILQGNEQNQKGLKSKVAKQ